MSDKSVDLESKIADLEHSVNGNRIILFAGCVLIVAGGIIAILAWPSGSGDADDRLIEMVKWTIGIVLTLTIALVAFSWFQYSSSVDRDRNTLTEHRNWLSEQNRVELRQLTSASDRLEESLEEVRRSIFYSFSTSLRLQFYVIPSKGNVQRFMLIAAEWWHWADSTKDSFFKSQLIKIIETEADMHIHALPQDSREHALTHVELLRPLSNLEIMKLRGLEERLSHIEAGQEGYALQMLRALLEASRPNEQAES